MPQKVGVQPDQLTRGTQILYVPYCIQAQFEVGYIDAANPHVQAGFVTTVMDGGVFCRFWSKVFPIPELRTKIIGEFVSFDCLVVQNSVDQKEVDGALEIIADD